MPGNIGQTSVLGYDEEGNKKWFPGGIPPGYTGSPPEIKEPEVPAPITTSSKPPEPDTPVPKEENVPRPKAKSKPPSASEPSNIPASKK